MGARISEVESKNALTAAGYRNVYNDTRSTIMTLSGLTEERIHDAAMELHEHYQLFLEDNPPIGLSDHYTAVGEMLRQRPLPWPSVSGSALNGLSDTQFFLTWAWSANNAAMDCFAGEVVALHVLTPKDAKGLGITLAIAAQKFLAHATFLFAPGRDDAGQQPTDYPLSAWRAPLRTLH